MTVACLEVGCLIRGGVRRYLTLIRAAHPQFGWEETKSLLSSVFILRGEPRLVSRVYKYILKELGDEDQT